MNPTNKKALAPRGIPQPVNRPGGRAPQTGTPVAQLRTAVPAHSAKRPNVSARFGPAITPNAVQPKMVNGPLERKAPVAPPVYRPQGTKMVQPKSIVQSPAKPVHVGQPRISLPLRPITIQMAQAPVARQPNIESVKGAFPILGQRMETEYEKIEHVLPAGAPLEDLVSTYKARLKVLTMFQQVVLANGINGLRKSQDFKEGEEGHIEALLNLADRIEAITGIGNLPKGVMTTEREVRQYLGKVKITKQQMK